MSKIAAIYVIVNKINHKIYLGSTVDAGVRLRGHTNSLKRKVHHNVYLQRAWNKYGEENFTIFSIEEFKGISEDLLRIKEKECINKFNLCNHNFGYNISADPQNKEVSNETRKRMSEAKIGKKRPVEIKRRISKTRKRLGLSKGEKNPMYGKPSAMLGKYHSKATIEKMCLAATGRKATPETRKRIGEAAKKRLKNKENHPMFGKRGKDNPNYGSKRIR